MSADARLAALGVTLPPPPKPIATYIPAVQVGNLLFISGHGPLKPDRSLILGRVGEDLTEEQGKAAARQVGLAIVATIQNTLGSLDKVKRMIKTLGWVNCTSDFKNQPQVMNGFSDLMVEVFGDAGKGARSAVSAHTLPGGIAVEVECILELNS